MAKIIFMMWTMQRRLVGGSNSIRMVRKMSGRTRFIWPVSAMFSAWSAYQTTGIGVFSVGKGLGTGRVDMWSG